MLWLGTFAGAAAEVRNLVNHVVRGKACKARVLRTSKPVRKMTIPACVNVRLATMRHDLRQSGMLRRMPIRDAKQVLRLGDGECGVAVRNVAWIVVDIRGSGRIGINAECPIG